MQYTKKKYYNLLLLSNLRKLKDRAESKLNTYNHKNKNQCTWNIENTQGKALSKIPTICIIIQGGNTSKLYKALALTASQLLVQSSSMLTCNQSFSQAFLSSLQAPISLRNSSWVIRLLPSGRLITHTGLTPCKTTQSSRNLFPSAWMSFLYRKTHAIDSTLSLTFSSTGSFSE